MSELAKANAVLSDDEQRAVYDRWGSKGIYAAKRLEGTERVNRFTMFMCNVGGVFSGED